MIQTNNFKFNKPESEDPVLIRDLNQNMDILDRELHSIDIAKIDKSRILTTMEEIEAVTEDGYLVDARCVSGLNSNFAMLQWNNLKPVVNVSDYNSPSHPYTTPADGYLRVSSDSNTKAYVLFCKRNNNTYGALISSVQTEHYSSIYCRKGMTVYFEGSGSAYFFEIIK